MRIIINNDNAKGVIFKGINKDEKRSIEFLNKNIRSGNVKTFNENQVFIGTELAYNLNLKKNDKISLMFQGGRSSIKCSYPNF